MRGYKECPTNPPTPTPSPLFSDVNSQVRVWRKVPESDAESVVLAATAVMLKIFLRRVLELVSKQIASPCRLQRAMEDVALLRPQVLQPRPRLPIPRRQLPQRLCRH